MATREDSILLQRIWDPERLGQYQDKWIAFRDSEILAYNENLEEILERFEGDMHNRHGPIIAFVDFESFQ